MIGALTDVGNIRILNEDYLGYHLDEYMGIYVIADGMGGHNAGEVASKLAVESTIEFIKNSKNTDNPEILLKNAIDYANEKIYTIASGNNKLTGMGTTITAALVVEKSLYIANIGDSSCHILKNNEFIKVTKDHSLVQELIDEGSITEEEARRHPNKNIITRALGTNRNVLIDIFKEDLLNISRIMLSTDGLTNELSLEEIKNIIYKCSDNLEACKELIIAAKNHGGRDNISVMIFEGVDR